MQTITVNLNLNRGSCRILKPLYLGETVDITFDIDGSYSLILTEPFADSPKDGIAVWAQSDDGKLALTRKALYGAFKKADALQPNMTIVAKAFVQDEGGDTVADGEVVIEYSPAAYIIDQADYPTAKEVLNRAGNAVSTAENAAAAAKAAAEKSEASKRLADDARSHAEEASLQAGAKEEQAAREAGNAASSRTAAESAKTAAESARDEAKGYAEAAADKLANAATKAELQAEVERATAAEQENAAAIDDTGKALVVETERAETAEKSLENKVTGVSSKVDTVIGGDPDKSARTIAAEEVAKVVAKAPADFDTLKEIAAYIESDKTNAAQMVVDIDANTKAISVEAKRAQGVEAELDGRVKELEENGGGSSVTVDDTLTKDGENPIKSKGIWSAIWGAGSAPTASVYDWCVSQLAGKLDKSGGTMTGGLTFLPQSGLGMSIGPIDDGIRISSGDGAVSFRLTNGANGNIVLLPALSGTLALVEQVLPRYPFVAASIANGVVTVAPFTNAKLTSDGAPFTVAVGGESGYMRDCVLNVVCNEIATKITWPENFHPRTDAETDFKCEAGKRNVYWITEYAPNEFCVAGWQETDGGGTSGGVA